MTTTAPIIDRWSPLSHKLPFTAPIGLLHPSWITRAEDQRRLTSYKVLSAYIANVARSYLPPDDDDPHHLGHREYGDADLLVDRVASAVLGDDPELVVAGANDDLPDEPDLPAPIEPLPDGADPIAKKVHAARVSRRTAEAEAAFEAWDAAWTARPAAVQRQQQLREWADKAHLNERLWEGEHDAVGFGDAVYVLHFDGVRPRLDVYDPGFYFPVLTDRTVDFPNKVHFAWEFEDDDRKRFVRRLTFELVPAHPYRPRYADADAPLTEVIAVYSDATWPIHGIADKGVDDFDDGKATYATIADSNGRQIEVRQLPLGGPGDADRIDFLPIVHVPNTPAGKDTWGQSVLAVVAQVLDDLAANDTDVANGSALAAGPILGASGVSVEEAARYRVAPGTILGLGPDGKLTVLDMAGHLEKLLDVGRTLLDRLSVNSRVSAEVLGRVSAADVASGVLWLLATGPYSSLIGTLRMVRVDKLRLLLKMVQRLNIVCGVWEGPVLPAEMVFGSFLPSDLKELIAQVTMLLQAKAISPETAVALLVAGGLDIPDAQHEVDRIRAADTAGAVAVADATGSEVEAAKYLGLDPAAAGVPPRIDLPPAGE